jgi:hypothetical protein
MQGKHERPFKYLWTAKIKTELNYYIYYLRVFWVCVRCLLVRLNHAVRQSCNCYLARIHDIKVNRRKFNTRRREQLHNWLINIPVAKESNEPWPTTTTPRVPEYAVDMQKGTASLFSSNAVL